MITGSLSFVLDKDHNYNTNFVLYPKSQREPVFKGKLVDKFYQYTWLSEYGGPTDYTFKRIKQSTNTIGMIEGTAFKVQQKAYDPTNLLNITDDSKITYTWKRDGTVIYELSSMNDLRGSSILEITSESCTREISGVYELEATNQFGTSVSEPMVIDVINRKYHPFLYKNLIVNGCGEQGLGNWTSDGDITVKTLATSNRNQFSIPQQVYQVGYFGPYSEEFEFSSYGNETTLKDWFSRTMDFNNFNFSTNGGAAYNRWIIKNFYPCLVPTDGFAGGAQSGFFPSWDYLDTYNKNNSLYKLGNVIQQSKTYITREKIKFGIYGGKAKGLTYQDISVSDISGMVDGEYYGVDRLVAHFFAYVGIGISTYKLEYVDGSTGAAVEDNMIPISLYKYKVGSLNGRPSFIPQHPNATTLSQYAASSFDTGARDKYARKIKPGTKIALTPVCYDKTDIRLDFISENGTVISSTNIPGPTEKDIWAVKEKFFVPYTIGNLYGWTTNATDQEFTVYSQSYTTIDAIRGVGATKDAHTEWIKKYHYPLFDSRWDMFGPNSSKVTLKASDTDDGAQARKQEAIDHYGFGKNFLEQYGNTTIPLWHIEGADNSKFDRGAAAFFGIHRDVVVPKGTRTIRVNIIFNHTSEALYDTNPRLKRWRNQTIYYDVFTKDEPSVQLVEYGNPRCAVTATHLSLHPNNVVISEDYNTYSVNVFGSVWYQELMKLSAGANRFSTVVPQSYNLNNLTYTASVSQIPQVLDLNDVTATQMALNLATVLGQTNANALDTGSGIPIPPPEPPPAPVTIEASTGSIDPNIPPAEGGPTGSFDSGSLEPSGSLSNDPNTIIFDSGSNPIGGG
jgi:hypothetical protein